MDKGSISQARASRHTQIFQSVAAVADADNRFISDTLDGWQRFASIQSIQYNKYNKFNNRGLYCRITFRQGHYLSQTFNLCPYCFNCGAPSLHHIRRTRSHSITAVAVGFFLVTLLAVFCRFWKTKEKSAGKITGSSPMHFRHSTHRTALQIDAA